MTKVMGLPRRWANHESNLIDRRLPLCRPEAGRAWSYYSRSSARSLGPPDGRPNPRGARISAGRGPQVSERGPEVAQPPAARWPRGKVVHAGPRMARRRGRAHAPRSGFHVALGASATCAFVGRGSRGSPSQSAISKVVPRDTNTSGGVGGLPSTVVRRDTVGFLPRLQSWASASEVL